MNNVNHPISQRLTIFIETLNISQVKLAAETGVSRPEINSIMQGRKDVSKRILEKFSFRYRELNIEWVLFGTGQMLKSYPPTYNYIPDGLKIWDNLTYVLDKQDFPAPLEELIAPYTYLSITDLVESKALPDVGLLLRLREALNVPVDVLLLQDISTYTMEEEKRLFEQLQQQNILQKIMEQIEEIKAENKGFRQEIDQMKNKSQPSKTRDETDGEMSKFANG